MALGRILVVDDEAPVREVLTEYFTTEGYAVEGAGSGAEALTVVRGGRADLVLLDVRMPGLDGVQVLRKIREINGDVPVIMVTANEDVSLAKETLKLGAFDYVAKPFDFDYLDRAVAAGLASGFSTPSRRPSAARSTSRKSCTPRSTRSPVSPATRSRASISCPRTAGRSSSGVSAACRPACAR